MLVRKWPIIAILSEDLHHTSNATPAAPIDYLNDRVYRMLPALAVLVMIHIL